MQMIAMGYVASLQEGREIVSRSFELNHYEPGDQAGWEQAYGRLLALLQSEA
jgi:rhamnulokinase